MAQHRRKVRRSLARCAGTSGLLAGALREYQERLHIGGSLGMVRDLAGTRIGPPLQNVDDLLV